MYTVLLTLAAVSVSIPATLSVTEGSGMVEVCATLSGVTTTFPIEISLATSDGKYR